MATTITVEQSTLERFNRLKSNTSDENVPELSADGFLKSLMDAWEENGESVYGDVYADVNASELASELELVMEPNEADLSPVLGRLDDLEAELPRKVAEELQR